MSENRKRCLFKIGTILSSYVLFCAFLSYIELDLAWVWIIIGGIVILGASFYFLIHCEKRERKQIESATLAIKNTIFKKQYSYIECDEEGSLARLFQEINTMIILLEARYDYEKQEKQVLKQWMHDISHQLKTPLTTLGLHHELLRLYAKDPNIRDVASLCEQETDRMNALVQNLLVLARLDAQTMTFFFEQEPLSSILEETIQRFESRAAYEKKKLLFYPCDNIWILCDRFWLIEALSNLVKNALDHTKENDTILLETTCSLQSVQIRIKDSGEGIDPADFPHIFKRFYRSVRSNDHQGIGLGLPLAKAIIEAHHGTLCVQSQPGTGTCFTISLLLSDKIVGKPSGHGHIPKI